jgi:hypothetical protein
MFLEHVPVFRCGEAFLLTGDEDLAGLEVPFQLAGSR